MIPVQGLISVFETMLKEHWSYEWGAARKGCVDCSGAFLYAYKQFGYSIPDHSSNYIARKCVGDMVPAEEAKPGYACFKWRKWTKDKSPARWNDGKGDFYHIGLLGNNGKVLEARGTYAGFVDSPLDTWKFAAPLLLVNYGDEVPMKVLYQAEVVTKNGHGVNLRMGETTNSKKIDTIPEGYVVDVLDDSNPAWWQVDYKGVVGYVSTPYLKKIEEVEDEDNEDEDDGIDLPTYGIILPCESQDELALLAKCFANALVIGGEE